MSKCELFKGIAAEVWDTISLSHAMGNRLREDGLTSNTIVHQIQRYVNDRREFNVFAQRASDEVNTGGDLEVYIDNGQQQFYRVLLQAKLMETNGCFQNLNRYSGSSGRRQYDSLISYADQINSDSYYLFYNGHHSYQGKGSDCAGSFDEKQYGCAIMNSSEIKTYCESNHTGTLGSAGSIKPYGNPWRFLTCCNYPNRTNKLYSINEIDMDQYFRNLFVPDGRIGFITAEQMRNREKIESSNRSIHKNGWNPLARIIISDKKMHKKADGLLGF